MNRAEKLKGQGLEGIIAARKTARYFIGIDPGVNTGIAIYDKVEGVLTSVKTLNIVSAQRFIVEWELEVAAPSNAEFFFILEDARLRKKFVGNAERFQGAGSVKRDSKMWCEFFVERGYRFYRKAPVAALNNWTQESFRAYTGYMGITSKHSRSAAMLVYKT